MIAAGDAVRWSLPPVLVVAGALALLAAGWWLGRVSDVVVSAVLDLWDLLGRWLVYALCGVGAVAVVAAVVMWGGVRPG